MLDLKYGSNDISSSLGPFIGAAINIKRRRDMLRMDTGSYIAFTGN